MTPAEFQVAACALLRTTVGWQTAIARRLEVEPRTVRRWLAAGEIPGWVDAKFAEMTGATDIAPWPRDEWLIGDGAGFGGPGARREYIAHLQAPRFVARIVACDEQGEPLASEQPCDKARGVVYTSGDYVLCEIAWLDTIAPGEIVKWMEAAADAIDAM